MAVKKLPGRMLCDRPRGGEHPLLGDRYLDRISVFTVTDVGKDSEKGNERKSRDCQKCIKLLLLFFEHADTPFTRISTLSITLN